MTFINFLETLKVNRKLSGLVAMLLDAYYFNEGVRTLVDSHTPLSCADVAEDTQEMLERLGVVSNGIARANPNNVPNMGSSVLSSSQQNVSVENQLLKQQIEQLNMQLQLMMQMQAQVQSMQQHNPMMGYQVNPMMNQMGQMHAMNNMQQAPQMHNPMQMYQQQNNPNGYQNNGYDMNTNAQQFGTYQENANNQNQTMQEQANTLREGRNEGVDAGNQLSPPLPPSPSVAQVNASAAYVAPVETTVQHPTQPTAPVVPAVAYSEISIPVESVSYQEEEVKPKVDAMALLRKAASSVKKLD